MRLALASRIAGIVIASILLIIIGFLLYINRDCGVIEEFEPIELIDLQHITIEDLYKLQPEELKKVKSLSMSSDRTGIVMKEFPPIVSKLINLEYLFCEGNNISDLTPIKDLTHLKMIHLRFNDVSDWKGFENLTNLSHLLVGGNKLSDWKGVENLTNLSLLDISYNKLFNLKGIKKLKKLKGLDLTANHDLTDLSEIEELTSLEELIIGDTNAATFPDSFYSVGLPIEKLRMSNMPYFDYTSNLSKFHQLSNLQELYLSQDNIPELNVDFEKCYNLEKFDYTYIKGIDIVDVLKRISKAPKLKHLVLSVNNIQYLPDDILLPDSLENLNLSYNKIRKLPIKIIIYTNLKEVNLRGNPIDTMAIRIIEKEMVNTKFYYDK